MIFFLSFFSLPAYFVFLAINLFLGLFIVDKHQMVGYIGRFQLSCVNNPALQIAQHGVLLKECLSEKYVLCMHTKAHMHSNSFVELDVNLVQSSFVHLP